MVKTKVHTYIECVTYEWHVKEIPVSRATEMADLSRHFKLKYSSMECRQFMEYRRNIVGLKGMRLLGSS